MTYIVYSDRHRLNSDNVNIHLPDHETQTASQNTNWDVENLVKEWAELKKSLLYLSYIYIILWTKKKTISEGGVSPQGTLVQPSYEKRENQRSLPLKLHGFFKYYRLVVPKHEGIKKNGIHIFTYA